MKRSIYPLDVIQNPRHGPPSRLSPSPLRPLLKILVAGSRCPQAVKLLLLLPPVPPRLPPRLARSLPKTLALALALALALPHPHWEMDGGGTHRTPEDVFRDFRARRAGMIKALTTGTRLLLTHFPPSLAEFEDL